MNKQNSAVTEVSMPDVQGSADARNIVINQVGVKRIKYPVTFIHHDQEHPSVAEFSMSVRLPAEKKGTHMSRFVRLIHDDLARFDAKSLPTKMEDMLALLNAKSGKFDIAFTYFKDKPAPVTKIVSKMDYLIEFSVEKDLQGTLSQTMRITVPVQSLCPCSKAISAYGAHNQRSHIIINAYDALDADLDELIALAEKQASVELYGLLKREDEKYVTEKAYENPKFVEDIVRDVARALIAYPKINAFKVEVENFESIHNHSAFAEIMVEAS